GFLAFAPESAAHFKAWTASMFSRHEFDARGVGLEAVAMFARFAAPALLGALVASVVVGVASVGFQFNPGAVAPKFERLNPAEGFKKLFSVRQLVDIGKALLVVAIVGIVVW